MKANLSTFSIAPTDVVFINVTAMGRQVFTATLSGKSSFDDMMRSVRNSLGDREGLLTVNFRNSSQGTTAKLVMRMRRQSASMLRAQMKGNAA